MGWLGQHLAWCIERNLRAATITGKRNILRRYARALGCDDPTHASQDDVRAWWTGRQHLSPQSRATELANVRCFHQWAIAEGARDDDPTARLQRPRLRHPLPRPIGERDLALALSHPPERLEPWLYLGAYAGLRCGEIAGLRGEHLVELDAGPGILVVDGKSLRQRIVPMHPFLERVLPSGRSGWLFPSDTPVGHVQPHRVSHLIAGYLHDLGIAATAHSLRHRFATRLYQASLDLRMTQDMLGHVSPETTARYAAWAPVTARATVTALP